MFRTICQKFHLIYTSQSYGFKLHNVPALLKLCRLGWVKQRWIGGPRGSWIGGPPSYSIEERWNINITNKKWRGKPNLFFMNISPWKHAFLLSITSIAYAICWLEKSHSLQNSLFERFHCANITYHHLISAAAISVRWYHPEALLPPYSGSNIQIVCEFSPAPILS